MGTVVELVDGGAWGGKRENSSYLLCTFMHCARYSDYIYLNYCSLITINEVLSDKTEDEIG